MLIPKSVRTFFPFALAVSIAAAVGGSLTEMSVHHWYLRLAKPAWTPPAAVFGPVWTVLYAAMALAAWLVYKKAGSYEAAQKPLTFWGVQLILNALWPGCFFALRNPALGVIEIFILMGFVIATTLAFWRRERAAGWLMLPYCLWGSFATVLTLTIWRMNRIPAW
jgi:tryptophan-rich sensory protein